MPPFETVQGGIFGGMNFQPLGWDAPTAPGKVNVPKFTGATIDTANPTIKGVSIPGADAGAGAAPASNAGAGASGVGAFFGSYFVRGVVIILGFVFVAVGLTMFKPNQIAVMK